MGYVYVMQCETPDKKTYCKIGITEKDPNERRRTLQTGCPFEITKIWASRNIPDYRKCESFIHRELRSYKTHGEWFDVSFAHAASISDKVCKNGSTVMILEEIGLLEQRQREIRTQLLDIEDDIERLKELSN